MPWAMMLPPNITAMAQAAYKKHQPRAFRLHGDVGSLDMPHHGLARARIHAGAALHARHQRFAARNRFLRERQIRAGILAEHARLAARLIDLDLEDADLVEDGLECAKGAEAGALCSLLCQVRQHDHQAGKQQDEDDVLHQTHQIARGNIFRDGLEGAEPHAVGRLEQGQRQQHHGQQHSPGAIAPARIELANFARLGTAATPSSIPPKKHA